MVIVESEDNHTSDEIKLFLDNMFHTGQVLSQGDLCMKIINVEELD